MALEGSARASRRAWRPGRRARRSRASPVAASRARRAPAGRARPPGEAARSRSHCPALMDAGPRPGRSPARLEHDRTPFDGGRLELLEMFLDRLSKPDHVSNGLTGFAELVLGALEPIRLAGLRDAAADSWSRRARSRSCAAACPTPPISRQDEGAYEDAAVSNSARTRPRSAVSVSIVPPARASALRPPRAIR